MTGPLPDTRPWSRMIAAETGERDLLLAMAILLVPLFLHAATLTDYLPLRLWTYDRFRWFGVAVIALALPLVLARIRSVTVPGPAIAFAGVLAIVMSVSVARAFHVGGLAEVLLAVTLVVTGWAIAQAAYGTRPAGVTQRLALLILVICTLFAVRGLAAWLPHCLYDGTCHEFYGNYLGFGNRRAFNQIQTGTLPFLFWLAMTRPHDRVRALAFAVAVIMVWMVITTGARGTALALTVTGLLVAWRWRWTPAAWRSMGLLLGTALAVAAVSALVQHWMAPGSVDLQVDGDSSGRLTLWRDAAAGAFDAPVFGQGPGAFATLGHNVAHAHSALADIAHDYGLIALLAAALFAGASGLLALFRMPAATQPVAWAACALLTHSLISGVHIYPIGQILLMVNLALVWGWATRDAPAHRPVRLPLDGRLRAVALSLAIALLVALTAALAVSFPDYGEIRGFVPRLWLDGRY